MTEAVHYEVGLASRRSPWTRFITATHSPQPCWRVWETGWPPPRLIRPSEVVVLTNTGPAFCAGADLSARTSTQRPLYEMMMC